MGGNAFANAPFYLYTPDMPQSVYDYLCRQYVSILTELYMYVASPADTPGKSSHGTIDILVSSPVDSGHPPTLAVVATTLSAFHVINWGTVKSFAVLYPDVTGVFVQLDVQVCSPALFDWQLCYHSYGDLWNILGTSISSVGLTANHRGLHLRIREIEAIERKSSHLFLTCHPDTVLRFVGLNVAEYHAGWNKVEDMFAFLARNRFMTKEAYVRRELKANDRNRLRDVYRQFVEDWMPGWDDGGGGRSGGGAVRPQKEGEKDEWKDSRRAQRRAVLQEALYRFGKRNEYDAKIVAWTVKRKQWLQGLSEGREDRKMQAVEDAEYADAWIDFLKCSSSIK